jgi:hypothetical protein
MSVKPLYRTQKFKPNQGADLSSTYSIVLNFWKKMLIIGIYAAELISKCEAEKFNIRRRMKEEERIR